MTAHIFTSDSSYQMLLAGENFSVGGSRKQHDSIALHLYHVKQSEMLKMLKTRLSPPFYASSLQYLCIYIKLNGSSFIMNHTNVDFTSKSSHCAEVMKYNRSHELFRSFIECD